MAFERPTLIQIRNRIESDIKSGLGLTVLLSRSFLKVMASTLAGASHTLHGHIQDFAQRQLFPDTADDEFLIRWANLFGINRLEASFAVINVEFTGSVGASVPVNTLVQRPDGVEFRVLHGGIVRIPTGQLHGLYRTRAVATVPGTEGNTLPNSPLSLTSALTGVNSAVTAVNVFTEGEDEETLESLRGRLTDRIQNPPSGGTAADYIAFARAVPGVSRVWVLPNHLGPGSVAIAFVEDTQEDIIPKEAKVREVQAAVDEKKPVTARVSVFAPTPQPMNLHIRVRPNTPAVQEAIEAQLDELVFQEAQVRQAVDPERVAEGIQYSGEIPISKISEAVSTADGEEDHILLGLRNNPRPPVGGILTKGTTVYTGL